MIRFGDVVGFLCDTAFVFLYLGRSAPRRQAPGWQRVLGLVCLLGVAPLYVSSLSFTNSWLRFFWRAGLYTAFLLLTRRLRPALAAYNAAFATAVCTITHNAFLTSLTMPVLEATVQLTAQRWSNDLLCALIVYLPTGLCYALALRMAPLREAVAVSRARLTGLCAVTFISLYIKEVQVPITLAGGAENRELSLYFIVLQAALLICLLGFEGYLRSQRENTALRMQSVATEALMKNIQARQEHDETVRRLRHDLKNHLLSLRLMVEQGQNDRATAYIDEFLGRSARPGILFQTGRPLLDGLMGEKLSVACQKDIAFSVVMNFAGSEFIEDFDLCILMGNALDNAVEACLQLPPGQDRYIDVRGGQTGNMLTVRIRNSCLPLPEGAAPLQTTKANKAAHGFGLRSIRRTLEKYGGVMTAEREAPDRFALTMTIPLPEKTGELGKSISQ